MKILLIGATSSLARALQPLLSEFAEMVTAGREGCDLTLDLLGDIVIGPGFDVVINTAAHLGGHEPESMIEAEQINAVGMLKLCKACSDAGVGQLVQVSSIFAELPSSSPFFGIYALSKRHGDEAAQLYATTHDLPLAIIRPSQLYGTGEIYRRNQPFLYALMDRAQANEDIVIYGANDARRNFIHVEDVARVIALAVQRRLVGLYACTYPENVRYSEVAQAAIAAFGSTSEVRFAADRPDIPDNAFAPSGALYDALGYTPEISMAMGIQMEAKRRRAGT